MAKTTKADIVATALDLFRWQGFHGTSMQDVGSACGLLKGSLYSHFRGKDDLLTAAVEAGARDFAASVLAADDPQADWRGRAVALVERAAAYLDSVRVCAMMHLAFDLAALPEAGRGAVAAFFHQWRDRLAAILGEGMPAGDAAALAEDTVSALEGAALWLFLDGDPEPLRRACVSFRQSLGSGDVGALSPAAAKVLGRFGAGDAAPQSPLIRQLAEAVADAEARALDAEVTLWRQAEAESCFGGGEGG